MNIYSKIGDGKYGTEVLWTKFPFFFAAEKELLESLPLSKQCPTEEEASLVKYLYENKLKKVCILSKISKL